MRLPWRQAVKGMLAPSKLRYNVGRRSNEGRCTVIRRRLEGFERSPTLGLADSKWL